MTSRTCEKCPAADQNFLHTEANVCDACQDWALVHPDRPRPAVFWIVATDPDGYGEGDFGVEIDGVPFFYYKWPDALLAINTKYRRIEKREFGEVIRNDVDDPGRTR